MGHPEEAVELSVLIGFFALFEVIIAPRKARQNPLSRHGLQPDMAGGSIRRAV
jgi:hypothetical protein